MAYSKWPADRPRRCGAGRAGTGEAERRVRRSDRSGVAPAPPGSDSTHHRHGESEAHRGFLPSRRRGSEQGRMVPPVPRRPGRPTRTVMGQEGQDGAGVKVKNPISNG
jgi:hypothetical protein